MPDEFPYDVFLSHSAKDKAVVRASSLSASNGERAGVRCRSLRSTERLRKDGLLNNSQPSTFISQLTAAPLNQERRFLPLRLDDAPIKGWAQIRF